MAMLPDFGELPEFSLWDQNGKAFRRSDLAGGVWVLDFIFTRCTSVCPRMSQEMRKVQDRIGKLPNVGLLSVSIDPEYDKPEVLRDYARRYKADSRWRFLTGDREIVRAMQVKTRRHMDPAEIDFHSKQFFLVDGDGFVRGVYSIIVAGKLEELMQDVGILLRNPARPEPGVS